LSLFVVIVTRCFRNDLNCVDIGVKLYLVTHPIPNYRQLVTWHTTSCIEY